MARNIVPWTVGFAFVAVTVTASTDVADHAHITQVVARDDSAIAFAAALWASAS